MSVKSAFNKVVDSLFYLIACSFVRIIQITPLMLVGLIGRIGGFLFYFLDARHRRVAVNNLLAIMGNSLSKQEILSLARENFARIGESYLCALKTAGLPAGKLCRSLTIKGHENLDMTRRENGTLPSFMFAIGHFGNFEVYAKLAFLTPGYEIATSYRGFSKPWIDRLIMSVRNKTGTFYFERRSEGKKLRAFMNRPGTITGLLVDQSAGRKGLRLPFLGRLCSTSAAPAIFSLRYNLRLYCCLCRRVGLGRWELEISPEIPTRLCGDVRSIEDITTDVNSVLERFVLEDPANWFWVHNRWKL